MKPIDLLPKLAAQGIATAGDLRAAIQRAEKAAEKLTGRARLRARGRILAMQKILAVLL